jgi:hypothetical protein
MWVFREPEETDRGREALTFAIGAAGGLALGLLLSRRSPGEQLGSGLRDRARGAGERARSLTRRLRPARLRRLAGEQTELVDLEDRVLDRFLDDAVLSERGIDIGAISLGIVELSGSVATEEEARHAVSLANAVPGVRTVINRLDLDDEVRHLERARRRMDEEETPAGMLHEGGRYGGMGRRRQGRQTDPDRPDDSQHIEEVSLEEADRQQWMQEGYASDLPRMSAHSEVQDARRTGHDEDELDNQDPHGKHASNTLDDQPREFNSSARVGEGLKPGIEMRLEAADLPLKPHQRGGGAGGGEDAGDRS